MIRRTSPARSGITLTEILISILIMGVGVVSIATLFPLGLLRLREANRMSRSAYLIESASSELGTRNLLSKFSFLGSGWYGPPTLTNYYNPWIQDTLPTADVPVYRGWGGSDINGTTTNPNFIAGPGLPVAYDPLWWSMTGNLPNGFGGSTYLEARFGTGMTAASATALGATLAWIRADPNPHATDPNSGVNGIYGLQRLTNLASVPVAQDIFVSHEDIVWQSDKGATATGSSPIVPDMIMSAGQVTNDFRYTWMYTGIQADAEDDETFNGDVVVFENRPFAIDPNTGSAAGETTVEAIYGFCGAGSIISVGGVVGYAPQPTQAVVLRWKNTIPDPEVRVGSWLCDTTYERFALTDAANNADAVTETQIFPSQRAYWYQVAKRTQVGDDVLGVAGFRSITIWTTTPLRALTLLDKVNGGPYHINVATIMPSVVNVFPRTIYSR